MAQTIRNVSWRRKNKIFDAHFLSINIFIAQLLFDCHPCVKNLVWVVGETTHSNGRRRSWTKAFEMLARAHLR